MSFSLFSFLNFKKDTHADTPKKKSAPLFLYNTLSKEKEVFKPIRPHEVGMYSCGPTVYDYAHIGNLRTYVFSDVLRRVLEYNDYKVKHVINITDVGHLTSDEDAGDDKMMLALAREDLPATLTNMKKVGSIYMRAFKDDLKELNIKTPSAYPRASEHVEGQIAFIKTLEEKGYTYTLKDGVYFDTEKFAAYGALGGISKEESETISRIGKKEGKHRQQDFALWKFGKDTTPSGKPLGWESPWGVGFPGWHIECSAMSTQYLGKHFDIHTGGIDHIAIHHNNEIAQTEAITGKRFVNYWLHSAFLTVDGKKISKSLGNTYYLRHVIDRGFAPFAFRYWLLTAHYRSEMNFTWDAIEGAYTALVKLHKQFLDLGARNGTINQKYSARFREAINDDLNTPKAIAILWELVDDDTVDKKDKRITMLDMNRVLGIGLIESYKQMKNMLAGETKKIEVKKAPEEVQELIKEREEAREKKDWSAADTLRKEIAEKGYDVSDTEKGPELTKRSA
ncbi:MAG: cysteine--tRNA ligase [Candidatus Pacebacteria bacterium]|nr:cysteine--tRNA ligase [Candidatus Paceibacterota bacterium]